jgi:hypothetical protein
MRASDDVPMAIRVILGEDKYLAPEGIQRGLEHADGIDGSDHRAYLLKGRITDHADRRGTGDGGRRLGDRSRCRRAAVEVAVTTR